MSSDTLPMATKRFTDLSVFVCVLFTRESQDADI